MHKLLSIGLSLALLLLLPRPAAAVSLGEEQILSLLGDPVEVEIEVLQWEDIDLDRVQIVAAGPQEYAAFDLTYLPVLANLDFNLIGPNRNGEVKVLVSSREPLNEPFLELLLVLRWPGGSLLREYVLLFDPPGATPAQLTRAPQPAAPAAQEPAISEPAPVPTESVPEAPEPPVSPIVSSQPTTDVEALAEAATVTPPPAPVADVAPAIVRAEPPPAPAPPPPQARRFQAPPEPQTPVAGEPQQNSVRTQTAVEVESIAPVVPVATASDDSRRPYQVRSGDNLWNIARQFQPAGAGENLYQVLLSLHELNRDSFINGNISLLKANAMLSVPNAEDIEHIDPATAEAEFNRRWEEATQSPTLAGQGEALPVFTEPQAPAQPEAVPPPEPDLPPDAEFVAADTDEPALIMASNASVLQPRTDEAAASAGAPGPDSLTARLNALTAEPAAPVPEELAVDEEPVAEAAVSGNPLVMNINESAESLEQMMQSRGQKLAELEQQVDAMRIRMQEAQTIAASLNESLKKALEARTAREATYTRNTVLLGTVTIALFAGLIGAMAMVLRLSGQLRAQRGLAAANAASIPMPAPTRSPQRPNDGTARQRQRIETRLEPTLDEAPVIASAAEPTMPEAPAEAKTAVPENTPKEADIFTRMEGMLAAGKDVSPGKS